ncbi:MAG: indolepyruvate ferredoxin oxidoreductase subunit alpha [Candidatus Altiarchaeales archaeon ex4484_2]|nr:MAG: indolepyruvate ferredoxin oxidoreductase subunit alpha [Candidatus Altiarchaeales archaeon ex4484_2]
MGKKVVLSGNESIARGALESGITLATGYPGTPSTEILEYIAAKAGRDVHAEWAVNEKVALETAVGASYSGVRALCCMKHVGVNVAADPLVTLAYTGVRGGLVLVAADDPGMHSSQNEQDSRFYAKFAKIPLLEPSDAGEARDMVRDAFILSEKTGLPVMLRTLTRVSHTSEPVEFSPVKKQKKPKLDVNRREWVMVPAYARVRHKILNQKQGKLIKYSEESGYNNVVKGGGELGVIASGVCFSYAMEFHQGDYSVLKIGSYPLGEKLLKNFLEGKKEILVLEEGEPFVEDQVRCLHPNVKGKRTGDIPLEGELTPEIVSLALGRKQVINQGSGIKLPQRPPVMCPGCPHRGSFYALKQNQPLIVTGDIGCYTLGVQKPLEALDTCLCMGASIGKAAGMSHSGAESVAAVIGESTFLHSGITSLMSAAYNQANILVLILDNSSVAMTGQQPTPATGVNIRGERTKKISIEEVCRSCGVDSVDVINPYRVGEMKELIGKRLGQDGVRVIVARAPCVMLGGVFGGDRYVVGDCNACRKCLELGCPAISFDEKEHRAAISHLCIGCGVCAQICPFDAIKKTK